MLKQQKGITLVALVITIVVLIILAGVAISLTLNENGLFNKAHQGANMYSQAQYNEEKAFDDLVTTIDSYATPQA